MATALKNSFRDEPAPEVEVWTPLGEQILVRRLDQDAEMTSGGVFKPHIARQKSNLGEVVAVGEGRIIGNVFVPFDMQPGDKVRFQKHGGTEVPFGDETLFLFHWKSILAVKKNNETT